MLISNDKNQVTELIERADNCLILPSPLKGADALGAAVGLGLLVKSLGKEATILYSKEVPAEFTKFKSTLHIKKEVDPENLVISIDYRNTPIEKINYAIENEVLNLVVTPVPQDFDLNRVSFKDSGAKYDLMITIGADAWSNFGNFFHQKEEDISKTPILNIDNSEGNKVYGTINVIEPSYGSISEMLLNKLPIWGFRMDRETAKALLSGIASLEA